MPTITPRQFCETLYCALAPLAEFRVGADRVLALTASVTDADATTEHYVRFTDVEHLTFTPRADSPLMSDDLVEFSAIEVEREGAGWRVWLNPWYSREVEFRCASIMLDRAEFVGTGRWLQDELPAQSAS